MRNSVLVLAGVMYFFLSGWAHAVQRTFVATTGSDGNTASNCSGTAPCRGFAAALSVTDAGGEIIVLSSGGYGPVVIGKSVSIISPEGVYAGISVSSGYGVQISTAGVKVVLRGLTVNGIGGTHGIYMTAGDSLSVENCVVKNMGNSGLRVETAAQVKLLDSLISDSGSFSVVFTGSKALVSNTRIVGGVAGIYLSASSGESGSLVLENSLVSRATQTGVEVFASGTGVAKADVRGSTISNNGWEGLLGSSGGGTVYVTAFNTVAASNALEGLYAIAVSSGTVHFDVRDSVSNGNSRGFYVQGSSGTAIGSISSSQLTNNTGAGLRAFGSGAKVTASGNTIVGNGTGLEQASSALLRSAQNNVLQDNTTATTGTITNITLN